MNDDKLYFYTYKSASCEVSPFLADLTDEAGSLDLSASVRTMDLE